ncbi:MAG: heparinase II/III-family protein, partial [Planctomycetales bacterium]|nr:heparinase II/III-family protein [Planctomycetales bacterium]
YLLPALGHACIGGGEGSQQTQFHLTWSGGYGHAHADSLSLLLFSNGHELLSDLGYTHTAYRAWTLATAAHNTVVIDGQNQALGSRKAPTDGSLLGFDARSDRVQMVSADGIRGYPGLAKTYRRTLIVVEANHQQRYAIDHFEVSGGQTHDYFLHGDADVETCVSTQLELRPMESLLPKGLDWTATRNEGEAHRIAEPNYAYGFLRELHAATVPINEAIPVSFRATIGKGPGLRVSIMPEDGSQLITGVNPAIRPAGEDDSKLDQFNRPFILLRREAKDRTSNFISVIEPYEEEPFLTSVERISLPDGAIAVRVAIGDRTDIIVIGAQTGVTIPAGQNFVRFRGDYGVMSLRGEAIEHAFSLGEGGWTSENFRLASTGLRSMPLQAMESGKLVLAATSLPAPEKNDVVRVVTSDGWVYPYTLVAAETRGDQLWLTVGEGPGFQFDAQKQHMQFASFPQREHSGAVRVEWTTRAER